MHDATGTGLESGSTQLAHESDISGNGLIATSGSNGPAERGAIVVAAFKVVASGPAVDAGFGLSTVGPSGGAANGWFDYGLQMTSAIGVAGVDLRPIVPMAGAHAVWIGDIHDLVFDTAAKNFTVYNPVTRKTQFNGNYAFVAPVQLTEFTVASLPRCVGNAGLHAAVTDAVAPAYNAALTDGGRTNIPVYCNGSAWTAH